MSLDPASKLPRATYAWARQAGFSLGERERIDQWIDWHLLRLIVEQSGETVTFEQLFERLCDMLGEGVTRMRVLDEVTDAKERLRELGWVERVPDPAHILGDLGDRATNLGFQVAQQPDLSAVTVERIVEFFAIEDREHIWQSAAKLREDVKSYTFIQGGVELFLESQLNEFHGRFNVIAANIAALPPLLTERERSALARLDRLERVTPDHYREVLSELTGEAQRSPQGAAGQSRAERSGGQAARKPTPHIKVDGDAQTITYHGRVFHFGGSETFSVFVKLWKNRPAPVELEGERDGRSVAADVRTMLKSKGLGELAEAIQNQRGIGYYLNLPADD